MSEIGEHAGERRTGEPSIRKQVIEPSVNKNVSAEPPVSWSESSVSWNVSARTIRKLAARRRTAAREPTGRKRVGHQRARHDRISGRTSPGRAGDGGQRRPGRRPGTADTRGQILAAARETFSEKGFDKATIRGIARQAGVDPALVHHYFTSKEGMFVAAMELPISPENVIPTILAGPREEIGERLVRFILTMTADAEARQPVLALVRTAMTNDRMVVMIREFMTQALLNRVAEILEIPPLRMEVGVRPDVRRGPDAVRRRARTTRLDRLEELVELLAPRSSAISIRPGDLPSSVKPGMTPSAGPPAPTAEGPTPAAEEPRRPVGRAERGMSLLVGPPMSRRRVVKVGASIRASRKTGP